MINKKFILGSLTIIGIVCLGTGCIPKKEVQKVAEETPSTPAVKVVPAKSPVSVPKVIVPKADLYAATPYDLPLFSIVEISKLPQSVQNSINTLLDKSQGFYFLKKENDKVIILLQNPVNYSNTYSRHDLQFAEIDINGNVHYHTAGYSGINGEASNLVDSTDDEWEFDETVEPKRPLKHIAFDKNGDVMFIERWNYSEGEPIKYEIKNSNDKIISVLKETHDNDSNYRKEHVFYDNEGTTTMSLSVNYDGANISRMTFYNSHDSGDSMSVISEYNDGLKTKELIYNRDYELVNTITADYSNGERKDIKVFDNEGKEIEKISS